MNIARGIFFLKIKGNLSNKEMFSTFNGNWFCNLCWGIIK